MNLTKEIKNHFNQVRNKNKNSYKRESHSKEINVESI